MAGFMKEIIIVRILKMNTPNISNLRLFYLLIAAYISYIQNMFQSIFFHLNDSM